jgi:hypothetical protein
VKKKIPQSQRVALIMLLMMSVQLISLTSPVLATSGNDSLNTGTDAEDPFMNFEGESQQSHSSPFYFPVQSSSPLFVDELEEDLEQEDAILPKAADSYYGSDSVLTAYLEKSALVQGEAVQMHFRLTNNLASVENAPIQLEFYNGFYRDWYSYYSNYYDVSSPFHTITLYTDENGEVSYTLSQSLGLGMYTVYASASGVAQYKQFTVGTTGIFVKGPSQFKETQDYSASVLLVNISDFSALDLTDFEYEFSQYDNTVENWVVLNSYQEQTNDYGFASISTVMPETLDWGAIKLTVRTLDDSTEFSMFIYKSWESYYYYSLWGGEQAVNHDRYQFVVTTDKTIYSPGETILLRALVMENSYLNETQIAMTNTPVTVTFFNPKEYAFFWRTVNTDDYGILNLQFPLDHDCDIGLYGIEFQLGEDSYRYNVKVQFYTKPVFRVSIDTNGQDFYPKSDRLLFKPKEKFEGFVFAEYYFGQPVIGAQVVLTVADYAGNIKYSVEGNTNGEGRFYFSIDLADIDSLEYTFQASTKVTDEYLRSASTTKRYTRIEELYAYGYLTTWDPAPEDTLQYYFHAYQFLMDESADAYCGYWCWDYNPLMNVSVEINVYGIMAYPVIFTEILDQTLLQTYQARTNIYGSGLLDFILPLETIQQYNMFKVELTVTLEDGRTTSSSTYFRYRKYRLDLDIQQEVLFPGDTLTFTATYSDIFTGQEMTGEGEIYIYDSQYQQIGRMSLTLEGSDTFSLSLSDFAPDGRYYMYSYVRSRSNSFYGGFSYHSAYEVFYVGNSELISLTTNKETPLDRWRPIHVELGEILEITGETNVSTNLPHYLEIYKRGLIDMVPLSVSSGEFSYDLQILAEYGPSFTIVVYTISDLGKLVESMIRVEIDYDSGFTLSTDKEIYEPGDTVTLTLSPNDNSSAMVSLSFIDSSVLDVEPEDDSELAYFTQSSYYAYINSGSSWSAGFPWQSYWWYGYGSYGGMYYVDLKYDQPMYYEAEGDLDNFAGGESQREPPTFDSLLTSFETEIRKNISESANWIANMIITEETEYTFKLPDNIGEWTIRVVGNGFDDHSRTVITWGAVETIAIKSFLPFFVEWETPDPIRQDDIVSIKAYVYNYLGTDVEAIVAIDAPNMVVLNRDVQKVLIPNRFVSEIEFTVMFTDPYIQNMTILAATNVSGLLYSDAKQLYPYIYPNGVELHTRYVGFLNASEGSQSLNISIDPAAIYHKTTVGLYTSLMDVSVDSWKSLIGYPYGCIEQTMSKLMPTALIYQYLNQTGQLTESMEKEMYQMIMAGLSRVYGLANPDGGWGWWHEDTSLIQMTAIVFSGLLQVQEAGFPINSMVMENMLANILANQNAEGGWDFDYFTANELESTAYVIKALLSLDNLTSEGLSAVSQGLLRLEELWADTSYQSSYGASLWLLATLETAFANSSISSILISFLLDERQSLEDMTFWSYGEDPYWRWHTLGNNVEITAHAIVALAKDDYIGNLGIIQRGLRYLLKQRNRWGWSSTADTAAAISSMIALQSLSNGSSLIDYEGEISVGINNEVDPQIYLNVSSYNQTSAQISYRVDQYLDSGENTLYFDLNGTGQISYIVESVQVLRGEPQLEGPEVIYVSPGENFMVSLNVTGISANLPLANMSLTFGDIPEAIHVAAESYSRFVSQVSESISFEFQFMAPSESGSFYLPAVTVSGEIYFDDTTELSDNGTLEATGSQFIEKTLTGIIVFVGSDTTPVAAELFFDVQQPKTSSASADGLSLSKEIEVSEALAPGELVTVSIHIENQADLRQFYALDDGIPAGTIFIPESLIFLGDIDHSGITVEQSGANLHFFLPEIDFGILEISYQLQIMSVKNSYFGGSRLWGMYDMFELSTTGLGIEVLPRAFQVDHSAYTDEILPVIQSVTAEQQNSGSDIQVEIKVGAFDNTQVSRVKIVYQQHSVWQSYSTYYHGESENFVLLLTDVANEDAELKYFVEVWDIYGNIASFDMGALRIQSTLIPVATMMLLIGLSIGLGYVSSKLSQKKTTNEEREFSVPKTFMGPEMEADQSSPDLGASTMDDVD